MHTADSSERGCWQTEVLTRHMRVLIFSLIFWGDLPGKYQRSTDRLQLMGWRPPGREYFKSQTCCTSTLLLGIMNLNQCRLHSKPDVGNKTENEHRISFSLCLLTVSELFASNCEIFCLCLLNESVISQISMKQCTSRNHFQDAHFMVLK